LAEQLAEWGGDRKSMSELDLAKIITARLPTSARVRGRENDRSSPQDQVPRLCPRAKF